MSRCYPFPPPGYVRDETQDDSLIESFKGTKEAVKKDRKHNKDKKRKERDNAADHRSKKHRHHKRRHKDESVNACEKVDDGCGSISKNELECLEKSCLTVELEHQTSSQTSCDSTLYSKERLNHIQSPPLDGRQYGSETSLRILLHGKEHEHHDAELMITNKGHKQCSSRESFDASQTAPCEFVARPSANVAPLDPLRVCQEKRRRETTTKLGKEKKTIPLESDRQVSRTPLVKEKPSSSHQETVGASKLCSKCPSSTAVRFLNLIENWAPGRVENKFTDCEDQELWLCMKVGAKRHHHQVSNQTTINGSSSMVWPTARFLPEAELHALPFTVPF